MKRSFTTVVIFCSAILAVLLVPFEIPSSIDATATIAPAREWTLIKTSDGTIVSTVHDHLHGRTLEFTVVEPHRGDAVRFGFAPGLFQKEFVNEGEEVGRIRSHELERTLSRLRGDLVVDEARVAVNQSSEKEAIIQQARHQLSFAEKELKRNRTLLNRVQHLHSQGLVSDEEYELAQSTVELGEIEVSMAEARIEAVLSGARDSEVELAVARVSALRTQIEELERQAEDLTFRSPISGIIIQQTRNPGASDVLINIADTSALVILAPVEYRERPYIAPGQEMSLQVPGKRGRVSATITHIDNRVQTLNGRQVVFVTAVMTGENNPVVPGIRARASIQTDPLTIREQLARFIKDVLNS